MFFAQVVLIVKWNSFLFLKSGAITEKKIMILLLAV